MRLSFKKMHVLATKKCNLTALSYHISNRQAKRMHGANEINARLGFTLIEVLVALSILAIALTALISNTSQSIHSAQHIHDKMTYHMVQMQGVTMAQLGLLPLTSGQEITQMTQMLNQHIYWRVKQSNTPIKNIQQLTLTVSKTQSGPFHDPLIAFRYSPQP